MLLTEAGLISTAVEAILYGFSVLMFILTLRILLRNRKKRRPKYVLIATGSVLTILATVTIIVDIVRNCQGFLNVGPALPGGPEQYFSDASQPTFVIKTCIYSVQTVILDAVVIYRTYVVWQCNILVVAVPILAWLGLLASSIGTTYSLATAASHSNDVFAVQTGGWVTTVYCITLATTLSCTGLIAYRIWSTNRVVHQYYPYKTEDRLSPVLRVIVESGAIYSMAVTAVLVTFACRSPGVYIAHNMLSPMISIVFNMIIIRVGLASDKAFVASMQQQSIHIPASGPFQGSGGSRPSPLQRMNRSDEYDIKPMSIEITQCRETDADKPSLRDPVVTLESELDYMQEAKAHMDIA